MGDRPGDRALSAAAAAELTLGVLLHPHRAARMNRNGSPAFAVLVDALMAATWYSQPAARDVPIQRQTSLLVLNHLLRLAFANNVDAGVSAVALDAVLELQQNLEASDANDPDSRGYLRLAEARIRAALEDPASIGEIPEVETPPGSPIGSTETGLGAR